MPSFASNFQQGDVIYGVSYARDPYVASLPPDTKADCEAVGAFLLCDNFNNRSFLGSSDKPFGCNKDIKGKDTIKNPKDARDLDFNWDFYENDLGAIALTDPVKKEVRAYFDALKSSDRSPYKALKEPEKKWGKNGDKLKTTIAIRRACKFGLAYVIMEKKRTVHFVLDVPNHIGTMINMDHVAEKARYHDDSKSDINSAVPITFSELRCCYRNRAAWIPTGRLKFYLDLKEVDPPWETDVTPWVAYEQARFKKHHPFKAFLAKYLP
jgi:hypothetical protein